MSSKQQDKKEALRGVFTRSASTYAEIRYFPIFGEWLVENAGIHEGAQVLDVASGRGAVLFPAAQRVGPDGHVTGIDLAEGMARETGAEIRRRGLAQAEMRQMDAEQLDFEDESFDFVLCGFALQFFPHLEQALSEFKRVLKPGGRVTATAWGDDDARWGWYDQLRQRFGAVHRLGSQDFDTAHDLENVLAQAGFVGVRSAEKEIDMVYLDEEEWWNTEWSISGRAGLEKLGQQNLEKFKAAAFAKMQPQRQTDGFHFQLKAFCSTAKKV